MRLAHLVPLALAAGAFAVAPKDKLLARDEAELLERGLAEDILEDIKDGFSCAGCETLILLLKGLAVLGDDAFVNTVVGICKLANVADDDVCEGAVGLEGPIIAQALRDVKPGSHTSQNVCMNFLGVCGFPDITEHEVKIPSEKPEGSTRPAPSGKDPIKVVHYSDVHVDHLYVPGSSANCTKPICCRPYTEDDEPGVSDSPAGPHGEHNCDTPVSLADSMYAAILDVASDAAFALCTGDIVDHSLWNTSVEYNTFEITDAYERMGRSLPLVYATAGNHEMHPSNAYAPLKAESENFVYSLLSSTWTQWIGAAASTSTSQRGVYSASYDKGQLRVISLNTNMWYTQNYWLYTNDMTPDPDGQIDWLAAELDDAEKSGCRVYIIGHMAPGDNDAFHDQSHYLDQVFNRYSDTIAGMFFGHTHLDEFQVSYSDYSAPSAENARAVSYIAPSLTPTSGHPSFRVYLVDPETFAVLDAETWIADMDNPSFQEKPTWTKLYSAKEAYAPHLPATAELSPAVWHNITVAMETEPSLLISYFSYKTRGWADPEEETCDEEECRAKEICKLRGGRAENNCNEPGLGSGFRKRSEEKRGHADDCGTSVMSSVLSVLAVNADAVKEIQGKVEEKRSLLI